MVTAPQLRRHGPSVWCDSVTRQIFKNCISVSNSHVEQTVNIPNGLSVARMKTAFGLDSWSAVHSEWWTEIFSDLRDKGGQRKKNTEKILAQSRADDWRYAKCHMLMRSIRRTTIRSITVVFCPVRPGGLKQVCSRTWPQPITLTQDYYDWSGGLGRIICSFALLYKTPHKTYIKKKKRKSGDLKAKVPCNAPFSWSVK